MLFYPFYPALLMAVDPQNVIDMKEWKVAKEAAEDRREVIGLNVVQTSREPRN